jgi:hypothetical protein
MGHKGSLDHFVKCVRGIETVPDDPLAAARISLQATAALLDE